MNKLAVFVEGQTEQLFVKRFVLEVAGHHKVAMEIRKAFGGSSRRPRRLLLSTSDASDKQFFVLIVDSASDSRVASDIRDEYQSLVKAGYSLVLGLRDVYPHLRNEIPAIRKAIKRVLPKGSIPVHIVLAIMEIEAWFLAEYTHFERLYPRITLAKANAATGYDFQSIDVETIGHPSKTLDRVYRVAGQRYRKDKKQVSKVVDALDYAHMYLEIPERVSALRGFCEHLDFFLSLEMAPDGPV